MTADAPIPAQNEVTFMPKDVDDVTMTFGGIKGLMPPMADIERFDMQRGWSNRLFNDWFYAGLTKLELTPKPGIDKTKALRHIRTIMGSFEPKHEHKEGACAYLLDLWFEPAKWEARGVKL